MKLAKYWILSLFLLFNFLGLGQSSHWVYFSDKESSADYLDGRVNPNYLDSLKSLGFVVHGQSKWLNAACVQGPTENLKHISFIEHVEALGMYEGKEEATEEIYDYGEGDWQLEMLGMDDYHVQGFTGKGITLALFDGGFFKVDSFPAFDSLWLNGQIKADYDFVRDSQLNYKESSHGMSVLSLVGAQYMDSLTGAAPSCDFVLVRTEDTRSEKHIEEFNWISGMEWADSVGVDIIHSSLGYSLFDTLEGDYTYADMDGSSTVITLGAQIAAGRGIFVTNSAGNSGNNPWTYITAPCDGKDVLCIGAVDSFEVKAGFSSFGPSSDGRVKPDVMAMGRRVTVLRSDGRVGRGSGTSFSGPIIAGMVACLMEAHPNKSNQHIFNAIVQSCDRYEIPDSAYGHGIPSVLKADSILTNLNTSITEKVNAFDFAVYPNPSSGVFKILNPKAENLHLEIFTLDGKMLLSKDSQNPILWIDLSNFSSGNYVFKISNGENVGFRKVVKL